MASGWKNKLTVTVQAPAKLVQVLEGLGKVERGEVIKTSLRRFRPVFSRGLVEQSFATGNNPTGYFAGGWRVGADGNALQIRNVDRKAIWVELPTRPHIIAPRPERGPGATLAWRKDGKKTSAVFANFNPADYRFQQIVHHPGTKGKFIFRKTVFATIDTLFKYMAEEATKLFRGQ